MSGTWPTAGAGSRCLMPWTGNTPTPPANGAGSGSFRKKTVGQIGRRFLLHVLPDRFVKIRHYGLLSNRSCKRKLLRCRKLLGVLKNEEPEESPQETWEDLLTRITGKDPRVCPFCSQGKMIPRELLPGCAKSMVGRILPYAGCPP
jgi:hypothetical protein